MGPEHNNCIYEFRQVIRDPAGILYMEAFMSPEAVCGKKNSGIMEIEISVSLHYND